MSDAQAQVAESTSEVTDATDPELRQIVVFKLVDVLPLLIWGAVICTLGYFTMETLIAFAGKDSNATMSFVMDIAADLRMGEWFAYAFGLGGTGYGYWERRLRKREGDAQTDRISELEEFISEGSPTGDN